MEREDFIKKWLEGKVSAEELEKELKNSDELAELKSVIEASSKLKVPQGKSKEDAWAALSGKIQEKKSDKVVKLRPWVPMSIAASVILFVVSYFIIFSSKKVVTAKGEHLSYTLSDGSSVILNADSKISFKKFKADDNRKVSLEGEAFFDVKSGGAFIVEGTYGTVSVVGTSFNVNLRHNRFEVACFSGVVEVESNSGQKVTIKQGESTQLTEGRLFGAMPFDEEKKATWRQGEFYFENAELDDVIEELERQFNIDIEYSGNVNRTYTGYFHNKDVDEALQLVFAPMGLTFEKTQNKVIVR